MAEPAAVVDETLRLLDLAGVVANGLLGGAVARRYRLDPVGISVLAVISALGGGAIRDVLLDLRPVALTDLAYLACALAAAAIAFLVPVEGRRWRQTFPFVDAVALGTWAVVGTDKALGVGVEVLPAILLGVITAVGGGTVRDVLLGQVPAIFQQGELYATAALASGGTLALLRALEVHTFAPPIAVAVGMALCILARKRGWVLPIEPRWPRPEHAGKGINRFRRSR